jgi:hypothetical protein
MLAREWADLARRLGQTDRALELLDRASAFSFRVAPAEPDPRRSRA